MDKKYLRRFLLVVGCLFFITIGIAYYNKLQPKTFYNDVITLDKVDSVLFHHSLESDTYNSSNRQEIEEIHTFLNKIEVGYTRKFEATNNYNEVIFSDNNNIFRKSYKFYNNGYVKVTDYIGLNSISEYYKMKNSEDFDHLITMFEQD